MQHLIKYFESVGFGDEGLEKIAAAFEERSYKKNDMVVEEGKVCRHIGFVESGLFQYFVIKDGEERTTYVNIENTFLCSVLSFASEAPARESIRCIGEGSISMVSKDNLRMLVRDVPGFKDFYIGLLEYIICGIDSSRHDLIVLTAEQRYEKMLRQEPHLLQQIPLQHLASMLGVTPRHLSRIRSNIR